MKASNTHEIRRICDQAYEMILDGAVLDGMGQIHSKLNGIRSSRDESWFSAREIVESRRRFIRTRRPTMFSGSGEGVDTVVDCKERGFNDSSRLQQPTEEFAMLARFILLGAHAKWQNAECQQIIVSNNHV